MRSIGTALFSYYIPHDTSFLIFHNFPTNQNTVATEPTIGENHFIEIFEASKVQKLCCTIAIIYV